MTDKLSKISVWILSLARPLLPKIFIKVEQDNGEGGKSQRNNYINKEIVQEDNVKLFRMTVTGVITEPHVHETFQRDNDDDVHG